MSDRIHFKVNMDNFILSSSSNFNNMSSHAFIKYGADAIPDQYTVSRVLNIMESHCHDIECGADITMRDCLTNMADMLSNQFQKQQEESGEYILHPILENPLCSMINNLGLSVRTTRAIREVYSMNSDIVVFDLERALVSAMISQISFAFWHPIMDELFAEVTKYNDRLHMDYELYVYCTNIVCKVMSNEGVIIPMTYINNDIFSTNINRVESIEITVSVVIRVIRVINSLYSPSHFVFNPYMVNSFPQQHNPYVPDIDPNDPSDQGIITKNMLAALAKTVENKTFSESKGYTNALNPFTVDLVKKSVEDTISEIEKIHNEQLEPLFTEIRDLIVLHGGLHYVGLYELVSAELIKRGNPMTYDRSLETVIEKYKERMYGLITQVSSMPTMAVASCALATVCSLLDPLGISTEDRLNYINQVAVTDLRDKVQGTRKIMVEE